MNAEKTVSACSNPTWLFWYIYINTLIFIYRSTYIIFSFMAFFVHNVKSPLWTRLPVFLPLHLQARHLFTPTPLYKPPYIQAVSKSCQIFLRGICNVTVLPAYPTHVCCHELASSFLHTPLILEKPDVSQSQLSWLIFLMLYPITLAMSVLS